MNRTFLAVLLGLSLLAPISTGAAIYFYLQSSKNEPAQSQLKSGATAGEVVTAVGKLIMLPEGEVPTVATVTDLALLADQPFFRGAKTGDKVLIYAEAKKAILYDPVINKIIEVAPVNTEQASGNI